MTASYGELLYEFIVSLSHSSFLSLFSLPPPFYLENNHFILYHTILITVRQSLIEHLPDGQQSDEFIEESVRSAQLRQSLGSLSNALQSDNINSVMANFQIDPFPGMGHMVRILLVVDEEGWCYFYDYRKCIV